MPPIPPMLEPPPPPPLGPPPPDPTRAEDVEPRPAAAIAALLADDAEDLDEFDRSLNRFPPPRVVPTLAMFTLLEKPPEAAPAPAPEEDPPLDLSPPPIPSAPLSPPDPPPEEPPELRPEDPDDPPPPPPLGLPPPPGPPRPLRPRSPRLPRSCGVISMTALSAWIVPVTRMLVTTSPLEILAVRVAAVVVVPLAFACARVFRYQAMPEPATTRARIIQALFFFGLCGTGRTISGSG